MLLGAMLTHVEQAALKIAGTNPLRRPTAPPPYHPDYQMQGSMTPDVRPSNVEMALGRRGPGAYRILMTGHTRETVIWLSDEARPRYVSANFTNYLSDLTVRPAFSDQIVTGMVRGFLGDLSRRLGDILIPDPQALPTLQGSLMLDWRIGIYHFEIEVYRTGRADWFWRDTGTNEYGGEDDESLSPPPDRLVERFRDAFRNE